MKNARPQATETSTKDQCHCNHSQSLCAKQLEAIRETNEWLVKIAGRLSQIATLLEKSGGQHA